MKFEEKVSLKDYSTMRVGGLAAYLTHVRSKEDLVEAIQFAKDKNIPILVVGHGTNTLFTDEGFDGLVIINEIEGFEVLKEDSDGATVKVGAGEDWDEMVRKTVESGWSGVEALTMVPGGVGAAPIANIGCYGQELAETLVELTAYDLEKGEFVTLTKEECNFRYRGSRFSDEDKGRFIIVDITLKLHKEVMKPPFYKDVEKYFKDRDAKALSLITSIMLPSPEAE